MRNSLLILALLLSVALSANLLTYTFPYTTVTPNNAYHTTPSYSIGTLTVNSTLKILLTVPGLSPGLYGSLLILQYLDPTLSPTSYISYPILETPIINGDSYEINILITETNLLFTNGVLPSTTFRIVVDSSLILIPPFTTLTYFYLQASTFPTSTGSSVANPTATSVLLRVVDIIRYNVLKVIYVSKDNLQFSFSAFPDNGGVSSPIVTLYKLGITNPTASGFVGNGISLNGIVNIPTVTTISRITTYKYTDLTAGYYLVENEFTPIGIQATARISFNSDPYACPFSSDYNDFYLNFQGCTSPLSPNGYPCASFDAVTQTCSLCIPNYALVNGSCYANTTCPARQYFSYGVCLNASATCGDFDKFTGNCLNCSDPANYYLANGSCLRRSVTCAARQWQTNYTCYNVSSTCDTFDPNTGFCLTCISNLYQRNTDGTCTLIVVVCPQGQYAKGLICVTIAVQCLKFNIELEKCQACIKGYYVENGACKRIVCPTGQVPSDYGIFCVNVSPLCADYDVVSGNCLTCKNPGYTVRNGKCLQESSPLAGCQEREDLGFGPCVGAEVNCKTFNLQTGNCDECIPNFYLDYTGHCVENAKCGTGQWSVNGECIGIPDNCLKVDEVGLCTLCINKNYRLHQGQCVYFKSCANYQYLNAGGQCVNVSPNCATWNPSNGQCITCKLANTHPTGGVCCPLGQVYSSGKCVDANTLQNSYQNAVGSSCLIRHPSLTFCLKCAQGYNPVYTLPYACAKAK